MMRCRIKYRLRSPEGKGVGSGYLVVNNCATTSAALAIATQRLRDAGILKQGEDALLTCGVLQAGASPVLEQVHCMALLAFFPWLAELVMSYPLVMIPLVVAVKILVWWGAVSGGLWLDDRVTAWRKGKGGVSHE